jgi:hypothetical protein
MDFLEHKDDRVAFRALKPLRYVIEQSICLRVYFFHRKLILKKKQFYIKLITHYFPSYKIQFIASA